MWSLIFGSIIAVIAIGLRVEGKIGDRGLTILLGFAFISGVAIAYYGTTKKVTAGPAGISLETFEKQVNEIKQDTLKDIKREVDKQKKKLSDVVTDAEKTREELLRVAEEAAPPYLSLDSSQIERTQEDYVVTLKLNPSKNVPFGTLIFRAEIMGESEAIIKELTCMQMHFGGKLQISDDGKIATLPYSSPGVRQERLKLVVSEPCKIHVSGTHIKEPLELEIK